MNPAREKGEGEPIEAVMTTGSRFVVVISVSAILLLIIAPQLVSDFSIFQLTLILIYAIAIIGLHILTGLSGQFSLGQSAFFAIGAYATAIIFGDSELNYLLGPISSALLCFGFGFLFGLPALRLSGTYLALATFALAVATPQFLKLNVFEHWTGGVQGLFVTKPDAPLGIELPNDVWFYYCTLFTSLVVLFLSTKLVYSRSGRAFMAIRDNEIAASSMGINVARYKALAFGLSAAVTGVAGSLGAICVQFVAPDSFTVNLAITLFVGMVVGGVGWLPGSLFGAAFIVLVPNISDGFSKGLSGAVFGIILLLIIFLVPSGLHQIIKSANARISHVR